MSTTAIALLASVLATAAPTTPTIQPAAQAKDVSLGYVSGTVLPAGIFYGITAVDHQPLVLDERTNVRITSGLRTVFYTCPDEPQPAGNSGLSFRFQPGEAYELVCRAGQRAEIRAAERC